MSLKFSYQPLRIPVGLAVFMGIICMVVYGFMIWTPLAPKPEVVDHFAERLMILDDAAAERPEWQRWVLWLDDPDLLADQVHNAYVTLGGKMDQGSSLRAAITLLSLDDSRRAGEWLVQVKDPWLQPYRSVVESLIRLDAPPPEELQPALQGLAPGDHAWSRWVLCELHEIGVAEAREFEGVAPAAVPGAQALVDRVLVMGVFSMTLTAFALLGVLVIWRRRHSEPYNRYQRLLGRWKGGDLIKIILVTEGLALLFIIGLVFLPYPDLIQPYHDHVLIFFGEAPGRIGAALLACAFLVARGPFWSKAFGLEWRRLRTASVWFWLATGILLMEVAGYGTLYLSNWLGEASVTDSLAEELLWGQWPDLTGQLLIAVIAAPLAEEIVFRGLIYTTLRERMGVLPAAMVGSLIFALIHYYSWIGIFHIFMAGLVFTLLYEKTGSLWPPLLLHALGNLVITLNVWATFGPLPDGL